MSKRKIQPMPKCKQKRHDCFACNKNGKCVCLLDTNFKRKCPFFKTKTEAYIIMNERGKYELS